MRKILRLESYFILITLLTLAVMVSYEFGMNQVVRIDANSPNLNFVIEADSDEGGNSQGSLIKTDSSIIFNYTLRPKVQWPYVTFSINVPKGFSEIDLSQFDELEFKAKHNGKSKMPFRIVLRNYNPDYFDKSRENISWKFNETGVLLDSSFNTLIYTQKDFNVPTWWVEQMGVNREQARPNFDRIRKIQWTTGGSDKNTSGSLELLYMEFRGKWIDKGTLYGWLLYFWMISVILDLLGRSYRLARSLKNKSKIEAELQKENHDLHDKMSRDPLTGALNRNSLGDISKNLIEDYKRKHIPFTACIIDVDHFKHINDTYGHLKGDDVLKNLVQNIHEEMNATHSLIRWGGEEFMLFSSNSHLDETLVFVNNCREKVQNNMGITFSGGAGEYQGDDFRDFINQVDLALLKAKDEGRNRIYSYLP